MTPDGLQLKNKKGTQVVDFTTTLNTNVQGTGAPTVVGDNNRQSISIVETDQGAVQASIDAVGLVSSDALDAVESVSGAAIEAVTRNNENTINQVADLAKSSITRSFDIAASANTTESQAIGQDAVKALMWIGLAIAAAIAVRGMS